MSILTLLFLGGAAIVATAQNVPSVAANNAWNNNNANNNQGWNPNSNPNVNINQLLSSPSILVVSGTFRQMYNYMAQEQQKLISGQMTRQQADQAVLNWVLQQNQNVQQTIKRIRSEVNAISGRLGGVYGEGSSGLSQQTQQFYNQLNQIDRNPSITLQSIDQTVKSLLNNLSPQMISEILQFDAKGLRIYSERFGCPTINGVLQFSHVNNPVCTNNNNNACGNGWGNNNNGNNQWGNNNGWNNGNGPNWNGNNGGNPNAWNNNNGGWNNGGSWSNGGLNWRK
ncbi:hypothetical protein QR680_007782 [Steinernema hermaphroditum]|uniref:SXP/RAL-2 family protein Ani s 5-like cation-binding domain-containing protein n=1 Tax=Steinernema hermaphroditum TaxID=289476 RepID=A0AA39IE83_9BILA|nr:hypothetical protein QR680_007782 [Steinernema hermaphroditum]